MSAPATRNDRGRAILRVLVVVFTAAAVASLILVAIDVAVGRPAAGDVFIASLNCLAAGVLWRVTRQAKRI